MNSEFNPGASPSDTGARTFNPRALRIIAGLGNPGEEYAETYHNAGALFVEALRAHAVPEAGWKKYTNGGFTYARMGETALVIPAMYMNESGTALAAAATFFGASPEEILIVHDENDIDLGEWKLSFGRGHAGHNGVKSVASALGTNDFWRLRIGVQIGKDMRMKAGDFVLQPLSKEKRGLLDRAFAEIIERYFA